jgi:hypothetical protein
LCRADHFWKIIARKGTDFGKFSFVKRFITDCNHLPEVAVDSSNSKKHILKTKVRIEKTREGK